MFLRARHTVRMRLTALYCVLFVLSAAVLLAITNGVGTAGSPAHRCNTTACGAGAGQPPPAPPQTFADTTHRYLIASLIALGIMVVVSAACGWFVAGRVLRPLRAMTAATRRISADSLHERLAVPGPRDELKDLGDTIDELLHRLEGSFAAQRRFVANASHELRTPLATMRAALDVAEAKPDPVPPQTIALAGRLRTELDTLEELLEGLLVLARAQHGALPGRSVLPLDYLVAAALARRRESIAGRNLTVEHVCGQAGIWVEGSRLLLRQMVDNVLDNAIGHNRDGGWIRITTVADGGSARLSVENGGDILDPVQVAELAQPFRRLGGERISRERGAGLGLSIVAAITETHRGSLELRARPEGGLRVAITVPLAPLSITPAAAQTGAAV